MRMNARIGLIVAVVVAVGGAMLLGVRDGKRAARPGAKDKSAAAPKARPATNAKRASPPEPSPSAQKKRRASRIAPDAGSPDEEPAGPDASPERLHREARAALASVGTDAKALQIWMAAINDPLIEPEKRRNLIEDLNEEGFADPKHPGSEELPLIEYRIHLIEQLAPDAMDEVNTEAFQEAYKDLANMYLRLKE